MATYTVDPVGNRMSKTNHVNAQVSNYTYDAIYQLTGVTIGGGTTESYTYDEVGNRLSSWGVSPYTYNSSNQLTSIPGTTFAYDNNGNLTTKSVAGGETVNYTWTVENQLAGTTGGFVSQAFLYDPFGRRVKRVNNLTPTLSTLSEFEDGGFGAVRKASLQWPATPPW